MCLLLPAPHDLDIEIPCMSIVLVRIYNEGVVSVVELDNYKDHVLDLRVQYTLISQGKQKGTISLSHLSM